MTTCEECDKTLLECEVIDIGILLVCQECADRLEEEDCGLFDARERFTPHEFASDTND